MTSLAARSAVLTDGRSPAPLPVLCTLAAALPDAALARMLWISIRTAVSRQKAI
jgi:hypothetical protein